MCGISGIVNFKGEDVNEKHLRTMMDIMKHRGPDDDGVYIKDNVGLGFVRLSILDLSSDGHQPMFSKCERFVIIFNGEVYNYIEIREELSDKYTFKSGTDTEVILASYQEWGEKCLDKFNGMFSLVIYDTEKNEIFAARDRFGIKPFYYYQDENQFIFASEIKSILPFVKRAPNYKIIYDYLMFNRTAHTEDTFFEGIKKMQHGHCLKINSKKEVVFKKWYNLSDKLDNNKYVSPEEYRKLFNRAIELRLRADVPVGVSLSGGIDSSSIVSVLIEDFKLNNLNTFSAVYGPKETDESEFINEFQKKLNNMFFTSPNAKTFYDDFDTFIDAHNEPCPDIGPYIQYKVMELASERVKVTLDGQGADEQLAGYHNFFSIYYLELLRKLKLTTLLKEKISYTKKHGWKNTILNVKYFIYYVLPIKIQNKVSKNIYPSINKDFFKKYKNDFGVNKMLYKPKDLNDSLFQHFEYKLEHLLRWEDLNAMHFSIESRVPFLDNRLVEATLSTPSNQKIYKGETKHLLREALKDTLPKKITNRKDKKGFANPGEDWFKTEDFKEYIYKLIDSELFKSRGIFNSEIAKKQYQKHLDGKIHIPAEIWKWVNLELWFRKFID